MIRGYCLGGGLGIAMMADLRFATEDAQFGIPAARLSIAYTGENIENLIRLVGPSRAKDILYSARRLDAREALAIGLINRVVPAAELEKTVTDYCATLVENAPLYGMKIGWGPFMRNVAATGNVIRKCGRALRFRWSRERARR
jgi:enoyl-CoA hydratase/carnithine racemase